MSKTTTTDSPRQQTIRKAREFVRAMAPEATEEEVATTGLRFANSILYLQLSANERKRVAMGERSL